jgi:transitional endoplasmic reticulum ATPase
LQLNQSRRAMGLSAVSEAPTARVAYDPAFVRVRGDVTAAALLAGVRRTGTAAMCFHGVPGTGKSAFARHLADALDRELVAKSASDLLSKWVGDTEHRIAEMFSHAAERADKVVLLLDEADTFLRDRGEARTSWEISHTNEFLARMERFPGIFICTTNLADRLDKAVLRRFHFRLEFLGLDTGQAARLFERSFRRAPRQEEERALARLHGLLAPSDFVNVARRLDLLAADGAALDLGAQLAEECRSRGQDAGLVRAMGFIH